MRPRPHPPRLRLVRTRWGVGFSLTQPDGRNPNDGIFPCPLAKPFRESDSPWLGVLCHGILLYHSPRAGCFSRSGAPAGRRIGSTSNQSDPWETCPTCPSCPEQISGVNAPETARFQSSFAHFRARDARPRFVGFSVLTTRLSPRPPVHVFRGLLAPPPARPPSRGTRTFGLRPTGFDAGGLAHARLGGYQDIRLLIHARA